MHDASIFNAIFYAYLYLNAGCILLRLIFLLSLCSSCKSSIAVQHVLFMQNINYHWSFVCARGILEKCGTVWWKKNEKAEIQGIAVQRHSLWDIKIKLRIAQILPAKLTILLHRVDFLSCCLYCTSHRKFGVFSIRCYYSVDEHCVQN